MTQAKKRSVRSDSAAGMKAAVKAAIEGPLKPPAHVELREGDQPFWDAIMRARAKDTWTEVDLVKAANLARTQADIERVSVELQAEGDVVLNQRGTPVVNPKHTLLETLTRRELAISRALHVHAEATVGKSEDAAKKLKAERDAVKGVSSVRSSGIDGLIPGISTVQ